MLHAEFAGAFTAITRTGLAATLRYSVRGEAATEAAILAELRAARVKDLATGATQVGPHRDAHCRLLHRALALLTARRHH